MSESRSIRAVDGPIRQRSEIAMRQDITRTQLIYKKKNKKFSREINGEEKHTGPSETLNSSFV